MNKNFLTTLEALMLIIWIITTVIFCYAVFSNGARCLGNPLTYGAKVLSNQNTADFTCNCKFDNNPNQIIFVDKKHWEWKEINLNNTYSLNFTGG
jgi:hypothetical protein